MSDLNNNFYKVLFSQAKELLYDESNFIAKCANLSALLYSSLSDVNWVGFYLVEGNNLGELCLGPFQGGVACYRIKIGEGVCGNAFKILQTGSFTILHSFNDTYELKIVKCRWLLWAC